MYLHAGCEDADDPERRPCRCSLCRNEFDVDQHCWTEAWSDTGHPFDCRCDECEQAYDARRTTFDLEELRQKQDCKKAGFDDDVRRWVHRYFDLVNPGFVDKRAARYPYLQIARLGTRVERMIESDTHKAATSD